MPTGCTYLPCRGAGVGRHMTADVFLLMRGDPTLTVKSNLIRAEILVAASLWWTLPMVCTMNTGQPPPIQVSSGPQAVNR